MHKYIILVLLFCFSKIEGQSNHCSSADSLMAKQDYLSALDHYLICYEKDTSNHDLLMSMANCLYLLGDYQKAKIYYHKLETEDLFQIEALSRLGAIYESQQNLPKAIKYNLSLSKVFPNNPLYLRKLGSLYLQGHEHTQALQSYSEALNMNNRDLLTVQGLSDMFVTMDLLKEADSLLTHGLMIDSMHIGLSLLKSRVKYRLKDYQETAGILHKLTFQTDLNNYYNKLLGYAFMQIDSLDKAIFYLQKSLLKENSPEYALYYLGLAYEKKKDYERSDYYYSEAIKSGISENISNYHRGMARNGTHIKNYKQAIFHYTEALRYINDPDIYYYLGNLSEQYYKEKNKAIQWYNKYLSVAGNGKTFEQSAKDRIKHLKEQKFMKGSQ